MGRYASGRGWCIVYHRQTGVMAIFDGAREIERTACRANSYTFCPHSAYIYIEREMRCGCPYATREMLYLCLRQDRPDICMAPRDFSGHYRDRPVMVWCARARVVRPKLFNWPKRTTNIYLYILIYVRDGRTRRVRTAAADAMVWLQIVWLECIDRKAKGFIFIIPSYSRRKVRNSKADRRGDSSKLNSKPHEAKTIIEIHKLIVKRH